MSDLFAGQRLDGKVVIVTGSTKGLGAEIARRAAALGAAGIVVCGRNCERGAAVSHELRQLGTDALFVAADLAGARLMRRTAGGGAVVNIITMASHGGEPVLTAYSASKGALATLTHNAGYSLQPDRIRVNGLNIGWTATPGEHRVQTSAGQAEAWLSDADASRPFGRLLRPDDIAPMVTYLLSDAAAMVTGSVIDFDQTVHGPYGERATATIAAVSA